MYSHYNDVGAMYEQRNDVQTVNKAFYTQGDLQLTDQLSVTLGVRYSKDNRWGVERRGGYSEILPGSWLPWAIVQELKVSARSSFANSILEFRCRRTSQINCINRI